MQPPRIDLQKPLSRTGYFQDCLEQILFALQPSFYCLNLIVKILIHGPDGSGKRILAKTAASKLNMTFCEENAADMIDENIVGTEKKICASLKKMSDSQPCLIYISNYEIFTKFEPMECNRIEHCISQFLEEMNLTQPVVFIASSKEFTDIYQTPLSYMFQENICIKCPNRAQTDEILARLMEEAGLEIDLSKTQPANAESYIGNLVSLVVESDMKSCNAQFALTSKDDVTDKEKEQSIRWDDVGGLDEVKNEIIDTIQLFVDYPQLKESGLKQTGILLYGPPGTGKTLLAKAVATECNLNFINVKGPELLNEYVGQSEDNVRKLFQRARESSPCVVFFDELDSLAPNRGQAGDSGGVMDRIVSQILAEMDGIGKKGDVFVIAATNRVDLVDPSLMRPGRFDKILEVPLPKGKPKRLQILRALTRRLALENDVNLEDIESRVPEDTSGADFRGLCSGATNLAFDRCIEAIESGQTQEDEITSVVVSMQDFTTSLEQYILSRS